MSKIITFNANGIRAAARKNFFDWLANQNADIVCIQETKAQVQDLEGEALYYPFPYNYYHSGVKKGYSGVALYLKHKPDQIQEGIGWEDIDREGRFLSATYGDLEVISLYLHSGTSGEERQKVKEDFMSRFLPYLIEKLKDNKKVILCGDINIAHKEIDIKNWRTNQNSSGFLPHERQWLTNLFSSGYSDAFRLVNKNEAEYSWWSYRGFARKTNAGWRIDYQIISDNLKDKVISAQIYKDEVFSDHAPVIIEYDFSIRS